MLPDIKLQFIFDNREAQEFAARSVRNDACNFRLSRTYQFYYRFLRPFMPIAVRQLLQRNRRVNTSGRWYFPDDFMQSIGVCLNLANQELTTIHPWPHGSDFAFVLTHDVETSKGMKHIGRIADYEESLGLRSSWNLVPYKYKIDMGLVNDLQARGFEIGIHGYNHDGQMYSSKQEFDRRAERINNALAKYSAVGFRSPMVHRNLIWLQSLNIDYDCSCFDIDPFQPAPGGVGSIWPFFAGHFVELPYTLPQDHTLFIGLRERDDLIWRHKLDYLIGQQGMALMLTHPDYLTGRRESEIYFRFLEHVSDIGNYWHATPTEVARWWRERDDGLLSGFDGDCSSSIGARVSNRAVISSLKLSDNGFRFICR